MACVQDGTEYHATKHAHMTSTSAHISPPSDPVPLDTREPYSRKGDEEAAPRTVRGTPNVERQAAQLPFTGRPGHSRMMYRSLVLIVSGGMLHALQETVCNIFMHPHSMVVIGAICMQDGHGLCTSWQ